MSPHRAARVQGKVERLGRRRSLRSGGAVALIDNAWAPNTVTKTLTARARSDRRAIAPRLVLDHRLQVVHHALPAGADVARSTEEVERTPLARGHLVDALVQRPAIPPISRAIPAPVALRGVSNGRCRMGGCCGTEGMVDKERKGAKRPP